MSALLLYTAADGRSQIQLCAENQTIWLTQLAMAELFAAMKQNISLHLKNLFADGELDERATVKESLPTQTRNVGEAPDHAASDQFRGVTKLIAPGNHRSAAP